MKKSKRANRVMALVFLLFTSVSLLEYIWPGRLWLQILHITAEAALIGGLADWFAVTALFRRPLGIPWHTALIPRNRRRVIEALANAIENELISTESIKRRLADISFINLAVSWVDSEQGRTMLRRLIIGYVRSVLDSTQPEAVADYLGKLLKESALEWPFTPQVRHLARWALIHGKADFFISLLLDELIAAVGKEETSRAIHGFIKEYTQTKVTSQWQRVALLLGECTNSFNTADLSLALQRDIADTLQKIRDRHHPVRRWLRKRLLDAVRTMEGNEAVMAAIEVWKTGVIERLQLQQLVAGVLTSALESLRQGSLYHSPAVIWVLRQVVLYWERFKQDYELQNRLEGYLKNAVYKTVDSEHFLVGTVVREALDTYSDEDLNEFVEERVGDDLAWIRINGSLVGGTVGFLMFLFLHYIYSPFIVPTLRLWYNMVGL